MKITVTKSVLQALPGKAYFRLRDTRELVIAAGRNKHDRHIFPFNINESSMMKHIANHKDIDSQNLVFITYMMYLFTLRLIFNRRIKKFSKLDTSIVDSVRESIFSSFDLVRYKIATMKCIVRNVHPEKDIDKIGDIFESTGLSREDRVWYCMAYYNGDLDAFKKMMHEVEDKFVLSTEVLRRETDDPKFFKEIRNTASYFASNKIAFIAHGNRFTVEDLRHDLMMRATQAYYWVRPFYSKLHALNYAKRAIQGWAWCLKDHYNDPSRERTRPDGYGGHENTIVQLTEENDTATDGYTEDHLIYLIDAKRALRKEGIEVYTHAQT